MLGGKRTRGIPRSNDRLVCKAGGFLKYWSVSCSLVRGRDPTVAIRSCAAAAGNVNYLGDDDPGDPAPAAYGPNYHRLRELKTKFDPKNFFRMNQNIRPIA
jgi:hypothetical protein